MPERALSAKNQLGGLTSPAEKFHQRVNLRGAHHFSLGTLRSGRARAVGDGA